MHDTIEAQLLDLVRARTAGRRLEDAQRAERVGAILGDTPLEDFGRWVYYAWSGRLVHVLPPAEFRELRFDRNRPKITRDEQERLQRLSVAVVGLSVGNAVALTLALEGACGHLKLADFDTLDLSNTNRLRAGVHDLGAPKVVIAARQIVELDPYARLTLYRQGATSENLDELIAGEPAADVVIDECDSIDVKFLLRERSRARRVPVLMETSDRGMLDVERFDLEPDRPLFHGRTGALTSADVRAMTREQQLELMVRIIDPDQASARAAAAMLEIGWSISAWPQLGSDVTLGGASTTTAVRLFGTEQPLPSGRRYVDLSRLVSDAPAEPARPTDELSPLPARGDAGVERPARIARGGADTVPELIRFIVEQATRAPSRGNTQPWHFYFDGHTIWITRDTGRRMAHADADGVASCLALGTALENLTIAAAYRGHLATAAVFPRGATSDVGAAVRLVEGGALASNDRALFDAIARRATNRRVVVSDPLTIEDCAALRSAAATHAVDLLLHSERPTLAELGGILGEGDRMRVTNPMLQTEFVRELRWSARQAVDTMDGVDLRTLELDPMAELGMRALARRDVAATFRRSGGPISLVRAATDAFMACSGAGLFTFDGETPADWVRCGRALERVWLTATSRGLAVQPWMFVMIILRMLNRAGDVLSQAEIASGRALATRFERLLGEHSSATYGPVLRFSRAPEPSTRALRLPLDWVLHAGAP